MAWEGEVWLFLEVGRWDFFNFPRNYFFGGVGWGGWKKGLDIYIFFVFFFFCDMVI